MNLKKKLKHDILTARKQVSLSQQKLADSAGIFKSQVARIEQEKHNPTLETLEKIAKALGKKLIIEFR